MDDEITPGINSGAEPEPGARDDVAPQPPDEHDSTPGTEPVGTPTDAATHPAWRPRRARVLRPRDALERLERQWEDATPLGQRSSGISTLELTIAEDPKAWDYLGVMTGASPRATALAYASRLEAELAADAGRLGRALRPTVALVPAGRLWHVVRLINDRLVVIDGPGILTPRAAVVAAVHRYRAELARDVAACVAPDEAPVPRATPAYGAQKPASDD